ncbi:MAG: DUF420 domain-containing protein [Chthoniobacterales bacterium]
MTVHDLPAVNASLNGLSTIFILFGWWFIKHQRKAQHIFCMVSALVVSTAFLGCYLYYHTHAGYMTHFTAKGWPARIYFFILITHLILVFPSLILVVLTVIPALRSRYDKHRRIAPWTVPIWLYVSITGVLVYFMLYVWYPGTR